MFEYRIKTYFVREAEKESRVLQHALVYYGGKTIDGIFEKLPKVRQEIVDPIEKSRDGFQPERDPRLCRG